MGFSDSIRRNMPGASASIAKHMLKHYFEAKARYPHFSEEQIFSKILTDRYAVIKGMSVDGIERVLSQTDTLVELTMAVVEHENPIAMSETCRGETVRDIFSFFVENETVEFEKFRQRVEAENAEENNPADTYLIESQIASLIDALESGEKGISDTSSKPVNPDVFNENAKSRETSQSINDQEYNNFSCPSCNRNLRINKSFLFGITSVVVLIVVILLANVIKTELTQEQSHFDLSPQTQMTFKESRKQGYDNPVTNWIEQKHSSEKMEGTYKLGYERGLTLIKKLATNYDAKINMLCDEAMKADQVADSLYLKGCVNGYKSYFEY